MTVQVTTLPTGLRVVTDEMSEAESAVVGVWVGVGARHEPWRTNGMAHLVEHMMFKGTRRRSAFEISTAIEGRGGSINAHTAREETAFYARVLPEDTELAMDVIADMLLHSRFTPKDLDRERQVILQEIGRDRDTPEDHIFDLLYETAFPRQRLGRSILGTPKAVQSISRQDVLGYVRRFYNTQTMVVVATGKVRHDEIVKWATRFFRKAPQGSSSKTEVAHFKGGEMRQSQDNEQLHLTLGFRGPGRHAQSVYDAILLGVLLGGSSSSRLFQKVREERGLAYAINASHTAFDDIGLFSIYAGTDPSRVRELMRVVGQELRQVAKRVSTEELDRAKAQVRADLLMGQESVMRRADVLGHHMLAYGKPLSIQRIIKKVETSTTKDIAAVAARIVATPPVLVGLGPVEQLETQSAFADRLR